MPVYKDTPNNRKLGRVGKELGDPKYVVSKSAPAKKAPAKKKAGGTKKPSKPALDIDTFLDAMSIMGTVAKVPGKVNKTDFIVALNKKKGRPSFSLFSDILMDDGKFIRLRGESEKENIEIRANNILKEKNKTLAELTTNQQETLKELVTAKASKTEAEYLKNTYNSRVKGVKEKRFSYADIIKIGRDMYD